LRNEREKKRKRKKRRKEKKEKKRKKKNITNKKRGSRGGAQIARKQAMRGNIEEEIALSQNINVPALQELANKNIGDRIKNAAENIVRASRNAKLRVTYGRRKGEGGRWRAKGKAQLQNCPRTVRHAALKKTRWEIDIKASFPTIIIAIVSTRRRNTEAALRTDAIETYAKNVNETNW